MRHHDLWEALAEAILPLTIRGGGIGANILTIDRVQQNLGDADINDRMEIEMI